MLCFYKLTYTSIWFNDEMSEPEVVEAQIAFPPILVDGGNWFTMPGDDGLQCFSASIINWKEHEMVSGSFHQADYSYFHSDVWVPSMEFYFAAKKQFVHLDDPGEFLTFQLSMHPLHKTI